MRAPSISDVLTAILASLAIVSGLLGAYLGTLASLVGLAAMLTARVMTGRSEIRAWTPARAQRAKTVTVGPIAKMTAEIREAAEGDRYWRTEMATLLSSLVTARSEGVEGPGPGGLTTARWVLLAGPEDHTLKGTVEAEGPPPSSRLKGKSFVIELQREVESIEHG